ncbi:hypothetical protein GCM10010492_66330 [Saccharothrix mutabilis subsp. mutabilis]|uniref:SUKH-3 immunity protein n=1 Tax=Saccharothrix mutabilis subsp. mutabilis TaxID=66855 RepID=A0ABN0UN66_9PSEU
MHEWSVEVYEALHDAGWRPGRRVETARWRERFAAAGVEMHDVAERFLAEFGGLVFDIGGPGVTSAKEPFELDPDLCEGEEGRFLGWGARLGKSLFPIGELDGTFFLGIDQDGAIYLVVDRVARFGVLEEGMEALVRGDLPEELA